MVAPEEKRLRAEPKPTHKETGKSRIFQPFRAIGHVTADVPFVVESRGQDFFLTTSIGKNFQTYNLGKMNLLFVSPPTDETITAMTAASGATYIAYGNKIGGYKRGKEFTRCGDSGDFTILQLLTLGPYIAGLCDDNVLRLWDLKTGELYTDIQFGNDFTASAIIHPSTYLNKVLVSSAQGTMQIWNIRTRSLVYEFKSFGSAITCLVQSPVVDVVAVGLMNGSVILYNIKMDEKITSVHQDDRVTAISFRTDEEHMMATGTMHGDIALWDLQNHRLAHIMKDAHKGSVTSLAFLNNQPILVTAGCDNAVIQWIFDKHNAVPRHLKSRSGHHAPPSKIRYISQAGTTILSAGRDHSLRFTSVIRDSQNIELSQKIKKGSHMEDQRLPLIVDFSIVSTKEKDWDNILTAHLNDNGGRTWRGLHNVIGKHVLLSTDKSAVKVTNISACGNFGFLGCASGQIDMFNMQSGIHRKTFGGPEGHKKAVMGLASDNVNRYLISASVDRTVKIWDFRTAKVKHTIELESSISAIQYHQDNDLLVVVCDDLGIRVIDIETQKIVREFWGHRNRITDIAISPDGRWIISASLDTTVRTWDLPTGTLVDIFKVDHVVSSLTFSPTGDFLATAHVDDVGIFLWANRTQFANISLHSITNDEVTTSLALPAAYQPDDVDEDEEDLEPLTANENLETEEQLAEGMITLSLEPRAKWHNLLNLDTIKKRNKPKEAPKAPEKAPFFLPTVAAAKTKFDLSDNKQEEEKPASKRIHFGDMKVETEFTRLLRSGHENREFSPFVTCAKGLSPSAMDVELRMLSVDPELTLHNYFMEAILFMLRSHKNFELAQTWLNVFLNIHGDLLVANPENPVHAKLKETLTVQNEEFGRLSAQIHYGLCLIDFARK